MVASIQIYPGDADLPVVPDAAVVASLPRGEFDPEGHARARHGQAGRSSTLASPRPDAQTRLLGTARAVRDFGVGRQRAPRERVESHFPNAAATPCAQILLSSVVFPSVNGKPFSFVVPLRLGPIPTLDAHRRRPDGRNEKGPG
jgi:hypothetical protein